MKKTVNKILLSIFVFIAFLLINNVVQANSINSIDMDVYIDKNGNATVTEKWKANLTKGTEGYRTFSKLDNQKVSNFSVSDETGKSYEVLSRWSTSDSFQNKAYKCGIHNISNGVELCWGISKYGNKTYTLKYNISNLITQYKDTQGLYFNFINIDQEVGQATVKIHSDFKYSLQNSRIWAFGNNGSIDFDNGNILMKSGGKLKSSQYMVALVRFEKNIFNTKNKSSKTFDDIFDSATKDVEEFSKEKKDNTHLNILALIFGAILYIVFNPIVWIIGFVMLLSKKGFGSGSRTLHGLDYGAEGKELPKESEIDYWREIPCDKDLDIAYFVCNEYSVVRESKLKQGIIGAILLKWIKEGIITVTNTKKGLFSIKDNNYAIDLSTAVISENKTEMDLLEMLKKAAGSNEILEAKEFEKWCKKNYYKVNGWFDSIKRSAQNKLEDKGIITAEEIEKTDFFGRTVKVTSKSVKPELKQEAINLIGLKKFLLDYSLMPEREFIEVHLWEEYLIFAQLMGIADKVAEQFSKIYPKFNEESLLNTQVTMIAINDMAEIGYRGVQKGYNAAQARNSYSGTSRSTGGGGSSFSSGGSSSGGSSGGGFR